MSKRIDIGIMEVMDIFDECLAKDYETIMENGELNYDECEKVARELLAKYNSLEAEVRKLLDYVSVLITHVVLDAYGKGKVHPADLEFLIAHYCVMVSYRVLQKFGVV